MKSKRKSDWKFDSCFICQVMEETEKLGRNPTEKELLSAFAAQNKINQKNSSRTSSKTPEE